MNIAVVGVTNTGHRRWIRTWLRIKTPQQVQAWRIKFSLHQDSRQPPLIREPRLVWVTAYEQELAALFDDTPGDKASGLIVIFVPSGAATSRTQQKQIEAWMESHPDEHGGPVEVHTTSGRFLWRRGRAVCFGLPEALKEALVGLIRFSFCEVELERLETQVQDCWRLFETDIDLMQRMTSQVLKRQTHIETMVRAATRLRANYMRLLAALEAPKIALPGADRRLFLELALQADTPDRLRMSDDAIEAFEEFYKHEREQFAEFRYFRAEFYIILTILLALIVQLLVPDQPITAVLVSFANWLVPHLKSFVNEAIDVVQKVRVGP